MEHPLPQSYASHPVSGPWSPYQDHVVDYAAGNSYLTAHQSHHVQVNGDEGPGSSFQHEQYQHFHQQTYVAAQNDLSHHPPLPDVSMSYWPTALPTEPIYYPTCYDNQDLSVTHCHTATDDHFQYGLPGGCSGVCGGTTSYDTSSSIYSESDTTLATPPPAPTLHAPVPHPTITRDQAASEHDLIQWDSSIVTQSTLYEGSTVAAATTTTYQATEPSYNQIRPYGDTYATATAPQPHYAPEPAKEERQQQPYVAASALNPDAQNHYVAPVPVTAPVPVRETKPKAESPVLPPRGKSPMGHLPYPEDIVGIKAEGQRRDTSVLRGWAQSPSPASTRTRTPTPTPTPLSPFLQTLTFITYPETEPRGHRDGRDGGGTAGAGGAESDELGDDDDDGSHSPPRRGRRGKKQAKKDPFLACFFCRGRKIACHPRHDAGGDRTCTQCAKRHLLCQYPLTSRRGQRKPREQAGDSDSSLWSDSPTPPSSASTSVTADRANSKPRPRALSKLPASSPLGNAA